MSPRRNKKIVNTLWVKKKALSTVNDIRFSHDKADNRVVIFFLKVKEFTDHYENMPIQIC